jgi:CBS domain-containing protein
MQARDLAVDAPAVTLQDSVATAVRVMAIGRFPGLVIVDERSRPSMTLTGSQVLGLAVPRSFQADPSLARTIDEEYADEIWRELGPLAVADALPAKPPKLAAVPADANLLEIAACMARMRSPLVAVIETDGTLLGAITLENLLARLAIADPDE